MSAIFFRPIAFFCRVSSTNTHSVSPRSGCWSTGIIIITIIAIIIIIIDVVIIMDFIIIIIAIVVMPVGTWLQVL